GSSETCSGPTPRVGCGRGLGVSGETRGRSTLAGASRRPGRARRRNCQAIRPNATSRPAAVTPTGHQAGPVSCEAARRSASVAGGGGGSGVASGAAGPSGAGPSSNASKSGVAAEDAGAEVAEGSDARLRAGPAAGAGCNPSGTSTGASAVGDGACVVRGLRVGVGVV